MTCNVFGGTLNLAQPLFVSASAISCLESVVLSGEWEVNSTCVFTILPVYLPAVLLIVFIHLCYCSIDGGLPQPASNQNEVSLTQFINPCPCCGNYVFCSLVININILPVLYQQVD